MSLFKWRQCANKKNNQNSILSVLPFACLFTVLAGCSTTPVTKKLNTDTVAFESAASDISLEDYNRRKWDNPVVADFDQDGFSDLLLVDHGRAMRVHWNNGKGGFEKPVTIRNGDLHGVAVGDFNQNGLINFVVAQGGGAGNNLRAPEFYQVTKNREISLLTIDDAEFEKGRGRGLRLFDADNDGDLDMLVANVQGKSTLGSQIYLFENEGNAKYTLNNKLPAILGEAQRVKVTDFNNDGILDLIFYGTFRQIIFYQGNGDLTFDDVTKTVLAGKKINEVTGIAEVDFDNDGDFDLVLSRSGGYLKKKKFFYHNHDNGNLGIAIRGKKTINVQKMKANDILTVKNFQKVMKKKVYLGKTNKLMQFKGDWHAGIDFTVNAKDATGFPSKGDLKPDGYHIGYMGDGVWRLSASTGFLSTVVIENVSSVELPNILPEMQPSMLLENNQGIFKDITASAGLKLPDNYESVTVADFNNDGYSDLLLIKTGNLTEQVKQTLMLNQGDNTFKSANNHNVTSPGIGTLGMGAEALDYNLDGLVDLVFSSERGQWQLFKNVTSIAPSDTEVLGNFITFRVGNSPSGKATALGAIITVEAADNTQIQRVGYTSAPYSQSFDNLVHFGLGLAPEVTKVTVKWTNGEVKTFSDLKAQTVHSL